MYHIIGAGTFGLLTAVELARRGHPVTCYDRHAVPSPIAAGNDSNKIFDYLVVADDETPLTSQRLALEARDAWTSDEVYLPHFHPVGIIIAACSHEPLADLASRVAELKNKGVRNYRSVDADGIRKAVPVLDGPLEDWRGYVLDNDNGWLHERNALISAYHEARRLGVVFVFGADGDIVELGRRHGAVSSITAASGAKYSVLHVILSAGANAVSVLDFHRQLESKCFTLAHIKVSDEEARAFRNLPVVFNSERGFFFEPDENNEIKICNEFPGFTRLVDGTSVPLYKDEIPAEAAEAIRAYLRDTMPTLASRPFVKTRICWCTDSPDRQLILCTHPELSNLTVASGDSGLSFMLMPVIGRYIAKVATEGEQALRAEDRHTWRWRPETSHSRDNKQGRYGGRGVVADLSEITEWVSK